MSREAPGASVDGVDTFDELLARWIDAEARGDVVALDALLHVDFRGDGPRGYVLAKPEWLDRYRRGDLVHRAFAWEDTQVRAHADTVFARGIQSQEARYQGEDCSGRFRATLMAVRQDRRWAIVNLQLSRLDDGRPRSTTSATSGTDIGQVADVPDER
jgi:ketosteroid isomerase-like protein